MEDEFKGLSTLGKARKSPQSIIQSTISNTPQRTELSCKDIQRALERRGSAIPLFNCFITYTLYAFVVNTKVCSVMRKRNVAAKAWVETNITH